MKRDIELGPTAIEVYEHVARDSGLHRAGATLQPFGYKPYSSSAKRKSSKNLRVTALLLTDHLVDEAVERFLNVRALVDDFVVFVDTDRASAETWRRAGLFGTRLCSTSAGGVPEIRQEI